MEAEETGNVFLTGYNQETGIRSCFQGEVTETGSMVLPARLFSEIVRKMPDDVLLFQEENLKVHISCGMSEFDLMGIDPEDFPELPTVEYQNSITLPQQTLRSMISQTIFAVSDDESRPIHTGGLFVVDEEGLTMVAVDGFPPGPPQGAYFGKEWKLRVRRPWSLPQRGGKNLPGDRRSRGRPPGRPPRPLQNGGHHPHRPAAGGEFLAWRQAIPRNNPIKVTVETKQLLSCIERVSLIVSEKLKSPLRPSWGREKSTSPPALPSAMPRTAAPWREAATGWRSASTTAT